MAPPRQQAAPLLLTREATVVIAGLTRNPSPSLSALPPSPAPPEKRQKLVCTFAPAGVAELVEAPPTPSTLRSTLFFSLLPCSRIKNLVKCLILLIF